MRYEIEIDIEIEAGVWDIIMLAVGIYSAFAGGDLFTAITLCDTLRSIVSVSVRVRRNW
jgi:hypothetical protein